MHLTEKGRGRALKEVWSSSDATVLAYMDVDLSTDLAALPPLVAPLISGHSDVAIGSRLARGSRVVRGPKREFISRCYNVILRGTLAARFSDAQCGFKAIRADVARAAAARSSRTPAGSSTPNCSSSPNGPDCASTRSRWTGWTTRTAGSTSSSTAVADLEGIARLVRGFASGAVPVAELRAQLGRAPLEQPKPGVPTGLFRQLVRFGAIGVASTLAYLALFLLLRSGIGAQAANLVALLVTAVANTAANRRFTFGVRGAPGAVRHQFEGLIVFGLGLGLTSGALAAAHQFAATGSHAEIIAVVLGNLMATVLRFLLLRNWVFRMANGQDTARTVQVRLARSAPVTV